jgi:hypothetical protein
MIRELVTVDLHHFSHQIVYEEENVAYYNFDKDTQSPEGSDTAAWELKKSVTKM